MLNYIIRRLFLIIPTLWAIITINFFIIQIAPGGPVDQMIAEMQGIATSNMIMERVSGVGQQEVGGELPDTSSPTGTPETGYRGARGLDPEVIEEIKQLVGKGMFHLADLYFCDLFIDPGYLHTTPSDPRTVNIEGKAHISIGCQGGIVQCLIAFCEGPGMAVIHSGPQGKGWIVGRLLQGRFIFSQKQIRVLVFQGLVVGFHFCQQVAQDKFRGISFKSLRKVPGLGSFQTHHKIQVPDAVPDQHLLVHEIGFIGQEYILGLEYVIGDGSAQGLPL